MHKGKKIAMRKIPAQQALAASSNRPIGATAATLQRNSSMMLAAAAAVQPSGSPNSSGGAMMGGNKRYNLTIHGDDFSKSEVIINPTVFPSINVGDLIEIIQQRDKAVATTPSKKSTVNFIVKVKERAVKGIQHLSVLKSIADAMGLVQRKEATVCLLYIIIYYVITNF